MGQHKPVGNHRDGQMLNILRDNIIPAPDGSLGLCSFHKGKTASWAQAKGDL